MEVPPLNQIMGSTSEEVAISMATSAEKGLSFSEIASRRADYGANKLEGEEKEHIVIRFICQFKDPLILMLLGSAILSIFVGQVRPAYPTCHTS
jgi:P-type Ca2+ transporter type 2C